MIFPVITIRQPWAALIVSGHKDIENRDWRLPGKKSLKTPGSGCGGGIADGCMYRMW